MRVNAAPGAKWVRRRTYQAIDLNNVNCRSLGLLNSRHYSNNTVLVVAKLRREPSRNHSSLAGKTISRNFFRNRAKHPPQPHSDQNDKRTDIFYPTITVSSMLSRVSRSAGRGLLSMTASVSTAVSRMSVPLLSAAPLAAPAVAAPVCAAMAMCTAPVRAFHASRPVLGLEEFFTNQQAGNVGASWSCAQLRNKSFEDLRKLWFVLLKEKNMLMTYRQHCRQTSTPMKNPERLPLVRKSMANIKVVIDERSHEHKMEGTCISSLTPLYSLSLSSHPLPFTVLPLSLLIPNPPSSPSRTVSPRYVRSCRLKAEARDAAKAKKAAAVPVVTKEMKLNHNNPELRRRVKFRGVFPTSQSLNSRLERMDASIRDARSVSKFEKRHARSDAKAGAAAAEPAVE